MIEALIHIGVTAGILVGLFFLGQSYGVTPQEYFIMLSGGAMGGLLSASLQKWGKRIWKNWRH